VRLLVYELYRYQNARYNDKKFLTLLNRAIFQAVTSRSLNVEACVQFLASQCRIFCGPSVIGTGISQSNSGVSSRYIFITLFVMDI